MIKISDRAQTHLENLELSGNGFERLEKVTEFCQRSENFHFKANSVFST